MTPRSTSEAKRARELSGRTRRNNRSRFNNAQLPAIVPEIVIRPVSKALNNVLN